ncbi:hypothetical protein [Zhaonella formicivorans]|uniref:hypothetical protein n=1 Tax=Zhaonella formicivorans TaxID=2528593 RepID=UPI0010E45703|nr:hypothetical protein [Zhaonella formicivorans]
MKWDKYSYIYLALGIIAILSFTLFYFITPGLIAPDFTSEIKETEPASVKDESLGLVEIYKHYEICNHTVKEQEFKTILDDKRLAELKIQFPSEEGWSIESNLNSVRIERRIDELCPEDAEKRHLAAAGEFLAVFKGPVGVNGGLERITDIRIQSLPAEWQEKVYRGLLDFSSEAELLEALDSLDEYE